MTAPDTTPATVSPSLTQQLTLNIRAEIIRAGHKYPDIKDAIGLSHGAASRRSQGTLPWKFSELLRIAEWLDIEPNTLLPHGELTWDLVIALEK